MNIGSIVGEVLARPMRQPLAGEATTPPEPAAARAGDTPAPEHDEGSAVDAAGG
jgi:hypothetical protein